MNLSKILSQGATNQGDVAALLFQGTTISYHELNDRVDQFAAGLAKLGLKKGSKVALLLGNSPEFVIAYYGIARLGAVSVPINPLYSPGEIQYILADASVEAVVAVAPLAPLFTAMRPTLPALAHVILVGASVEGALEFSQVLGSGEAFADVEIAEEDLAVIL
ncbi:MAG: AMP-binding protein, partial [Tumebacillaceae bacterium]